MKKRLPYLILFFVIFCVNRPGWAQLESLGHPLFPLEKGSYWLYEGTAQWADPKSEKILTKNITWKMMITDVVNHGALVVAILKGHPQDMAWYQEGIQPGNYIIIKSGVKYYLLTEDRFAETLSRLADPDDELNDLMQDDNLFLEESPSGIAKAFGEPEHLARSDWAYIWYVEDISRVDLKDLKGSTVTGKQLQYRLSYQSLPDDVHMDVVPGLGITRYIYNHHGTVANADMKLVEYFAG